MLPDQLPLSGLRVIEFCQIAAGPFCGMLLADLGADVIKVENPMGGDDLRRWPPITNGFSENFASLNRNKRSVALDLKDPEDRQAALDLCYSADIVIENNRPGVMARLGLDYDAVRARNPKIVYASISGFGQVGPRALSGGFDVTIQAVSGVMSVTGDPAGGPAKCGVPISDFSTGLYCAYAIVSALRDVSASGQGHYIDMSLLGATLGVSALQTSEFFGTGRSPRRLGSAHPRNAPYEAFKASDVWFVMAAGNDKLWQSVCKVVGLEELIADPRFITNSDRADHQEELRVILNAIFGQKPAQVWLHELEKLGIPCGPINTFADALADEQVASMGWVQGIELPGGIKTQTFGCPIRLDGKTLPIRRNPPELGQHNSEILPSSRGKRVSAQEKDDAAATAL